MLTFIFGDSSLTFRNCSRVIHKYRVVNKYEGGLIRFRPQHEDSSTRK